MDKTLGKEIRKLEKYIFERSNKNGWIKENNKRF